MAPGGATRPRPGLAPICLPHHPLHTSCHQPTPRATTSCCSQASPPKSFLPPPQPAWPSPVPLPSATPSPGCAFCPQPHSPKDAQASSARLSSTPPDRRESSAPRGHATCPGHSVGRGRARPARPGRVCAAYLEEHPRGQQLGAPESVGDHGGYHRASGVSLCVTQQRGRGPRAGRPPGLARAPTALPLPRSQDQPGEAPGLASLCAGRGWKTLWLRSNK